MEALGLRALTLLGENLIHHQKMETGTACLLEARQRALHPKAGQEILEGALLKAFATLRAKFSSEKEYEDYLQETDQNRSEILTGFLEPKT